MRRAQPDALRRNQQLDAENGGKIVRHIGQTARRVRGHRHMIFLVGAGRRRIDRAGRGALLVLGIEGCRRHFGDHEAGVEAGIRRQERRQAEVQRGIDEGGDAPLADRADLGQDKRNLVCGKGDRLGVKISARDDLAGLDQYQRIVGDGVGFDRQRAGGLRQQVKRGAGHLRLAAQAIGILHTLIAFQMRVPDIAALQQYCQRRAGGDLPGMPAQLLDLGAERRRRGHRRIDRQGTCHQRRAGETMGAQQAGNGIGRRKLRTVDQREAFLRPEGDRRETGSGQRIKARYDLAVDKRLPLADHDGGHMRERRQIAGRAYRSLLRHQRTNAVRQHGLELLDDFAANARSAPPQRDDLQRHHQAHDRFGRGRPYPAAMRHNEVSLQQRRLVRRNSFRRQFSEPGIDAVNRRLRTRGLRNNGRCRLDARPERWIEHDGRARKHLRQIVEADPSGRNDNGCIPVAHCPLHTLLCNGLKPIR